MGGSASEDHWADPRGEYLTTSAATAVYRMFDEQSNDLSAMPAAGEALNGRISYHLRAGKHDLLEFDWEHYLNFADCYLSDEPSCLQ